MDRFSRQMALPEVGEKGQRKLRESCVAIVGMGALGSVMAELLCRAGVGRLILVDHDLVERSNLQRQALYIDADVGKRKVDAALGRLKAIDPDIEVAIAAGYLTVPKLHILDEADLIMDGTDNMDSRFLLNEYCLSKGKPCVFTSAVADRGTVLVVDPKRRDQDEGPCFNCIFSGRRSEDDCGTAGVLNGTTHLASSVAASEALKLLLGLPLLQGLFSFSLFDSRFESFAAKRREGCDACKGVFPRLSGEVGFSFRYCRRQGCVVAEPVAREASPGLFSGCEPIEGGFLVEGQRILLTGHGGLAFPGLELVDAAAALVERIQGEKRDI